MAVDSVLGCLLHPECSKEGADHLRVHYVQIAHVARASGPVPQREKGRGREREHGTRERGGDVHIACSTQKSFVHVLRAHHFATLTQVPVCPNSYQTKVSGFPLGYGLCLFGPLVLQQHVS